MKEIGPTDHNALFITLDSCRWDTYQEAYTPVMDNIGKAQAAQTVGNFTLPAHAAFFVGQLPRLPGDIDLPLDNLDRLQTWRLTRARKVDREVCIALEGHTIQEGYRNRGFTIKGFGGTGYFWDRDDLLRLPFEEGEFIHFGAREVGQKDKWEYPRIKKTFPFANVEEIAASVKDARNWFIFINAPETHWPYNLEPIEGTELESLVKYAYQFRGGRSDQERKHNYDNGGRQLHHLQIKSLEYIDTQLGKLLHMLPLDKPLVIVICGDHGESFGENYLWGHVFNTPEVLTVPLLRNLNYKF